MCRIFFAENLNQRENMAVKKNTEEQLPDKDEAIKIFEPALMPLYDGFREKLHRLKQNPPQLLHIEGGSAELRTAFAHYYAALFFCRTPAVCFNDMEKNFAYGEMIQPCTHCPECFKVAAHMHPDLMVFDSREANIDVDSMRELKKISTEAPRHADKRLVLLLETQKLSAISGNAILKLLEEPNPYNVYVFTMSQREMVLPTLLSRGFTLTLPWKDALSELTETEKEWETVLIKFFGSGSGLLDKTSVKGAVDAELAKCICGILQKNFAHAMAGRKEFVLASLFAQLPFSKLFEANERVAACYEMLNLTVNPTYAVEALLTELFVFLKTAGRK